MTSVLEVPQASDLDGLPVEFVTDEETTVVTVTSRAGDGSTVTLSWNEIARSVHLRWSAAGHSRFIVERETASKVSIREHRGGVEFRVWSASPGVGGQLVVRVDDRVTVEDALLRV